MKKLLALLLLSPLAVAEETEFFEVSDIASVESTCNYYFDSGIDITKCMDSFKTAKKLTEVYLPKDAEMKTPNDLKSKGKSVDATPLTTSNKVDIKPCKNDDYACRRRSSEAYQKLWKKELDGKYFELTSNKNEWFSFWKDGTMYGYTYATDSTKDTGRFNMSGAWEMSDWGYSGVDYAYMELFAGKLQCTYQVSKKGKLFWFEQKEANYNNVCPSMLMKSTLHVVNAAKPKL